MSENCPNCGGEGVVKVKYSGSSVRGCQACGGTGDKKRPACSTCGLPMVHSGINGWQCWLDYSNILKGSGRESHKQLAREYDNAWVYTNRYWNYWDLIMDQFEWKNIGRLSDWEDVRKEID